MNATIVIPICCVCNRVREHNPLAGQIESWNTLGVFLHTHHISSGEYHLTTTYCPDCSVHFRKQFKSDGEKTPDLAPVSVQNNAAAAILDVFSRVQKCDLDMLVRACPTLTWNQVFS